MKEETTVINNTYHVPVLYNEALEALNIRRDGIYVDCTFGGGGHSKGILERLGDKGKLVAFDQDEDARRNIKQDERLIFISSNFRHLQRFLRLHKIEKVDGILADLGVSSHQFNESERGFSIRFKGPMDMRMDTRQIATAADILQSYSEPQLHKMFELYGEVTNAKTLAKHIVEHRNAGSFKTIESFMSSLQSVVKGNPNKYFAQVFQALRIEVNDELGALKDLLQQTVIVLKNSGRIAIITFHSGEDRLIKNFFKSSSFEEKIDDNPFESKEKKKEFLVITKKPIVPTNEEMKQNSRSRSAKLRVAEKI